MVGGLKKGGGAGGKVTNQNSCISPCMCFSYVFLLHFAHVFHLYFSCISYVFLSRISLMYFSHVFLSCISPFQFHSQPYPPGQLPRPNSLNDFNEVEEEVTILLACLIWYQQHIVKSCTMFRGGILAKWATRTSWTSLSECWRIWTSQRRRRWTCATFHGTCGNVFWDVKMFFHDMFWIFTDI